MKIIRVIRVQAETKKHKEEAECLEKILNYLVHKKIMNSLFSFGKVKTCYEDDKK